MFLIYAYIGDIYSYNSATVTCNDHSYMYNWPLWEKKVIDHYKKTTMFKQTSINMWQNKILLVIKTYTQLTTNGTLKVVMGKMVSR